MCRCFPVAGKLSLGQIHDRHMRAEETEHRRLLSSATREAQDLLARDTGKDARREKASQRFRQDLNLSVDVLPQQREVQVEPGDGVAAALAHFFFP